MAARRIGTAGAHWASTLLRNQSVHSPVLGGQAALRIPCGLWRDEALTGGQGFAAQGVHFSSSHAQARGEAEADSAPVSSGNEAAADAPPTKGRYRRVELMAAFTCNKCGARTARGFSKVAYETGVVIARCGGCDVQHLLSDQLGWFGDKGTIEDILREKGQDIRKYVDSDSVLQLTPEDLEGWSK